MPRLCPEGVKGYRTRSRRGGYHARGRSAYGGNLPPTKMTMRDVCIFEDKSYLQLLPLVYLKPVYQLRCGMVSLQEKIVRNYPQSRIRLFCRDYLAPVLSEEINYPVNECLPGRGCLFINGRLLLSAPIPVEGDEEIGIKEDAVVYARLSVENSSSISPQTVLASDFINQLKDKGVKIVQVEASLINYPWDLIRHNAEQLREDFKLLAPQPDIKGQVHKGAFVLNEKEVYIGQGTKIAPGVVLDAEKGPIYIGRDATVLPHAVIEGPAFVGDKSLIKTGAKIYKGTSIGEVCKVGGEVEESIIHGYSNKQHYGFLGHAYLGTWVNLGAGTTISNLKNNYRNVRVYLEGKWMDTGLMFLGPAIADHAKTGINSMLAAGTVVGVGANIFGGGFLPKFIPSFSWCEEGNMVAYQLEKFIETAGKAMARRNKQLSLTDEDLIREVFELTRMEREAVETAG